MFKQSNYTSCIKINGHPILPPLISDEYRLILNQLKQKAIETETKLKKSKLKRNEQRTSLEYKLTFETCENDKINSDTNTSYQTENNLVPYNSTLQSNKSPSLSCNLIDVSQYSDEGIILFETVDDFSACSHSLSEPDYKLSENSDTEDETVKIKPSDKEEPKPLLIRSNSYVLESPSPLLLQHFQKQAEDQLVEHKRRLSTIENELHNLSFTKSEGNVLKQLNVETVANHHSDSQLLNHSQLQTDREQVLNLLKEYDQQSSTVDNLSLNYQMHLEVYQQIPDVQITDLTSDRTFTDSYSQTVYSVSSETIDLSTPNHFLCDTETDLSFRSNETDRNHLRVNRECQIKWAAIVLTAAAKGYLVRRLKRTEKVGILIQTIKEALVCAVSLHTEQTDNIQPADVELHRRLIQQVSAACHAFHEVFFKLSTKEKMHIIALDRQKQLDKLNKLRSLNSSRSSNTSLTPKEQKPRLKRRFQQTIAL